MITVELSIVSDTVRDNAVAVGKPCLTGVLYWDVSPGCLWIEKLRMEECCT